MVGPKLSRVLSRAFGILLLTLLATGARAQLVASGPVNINGQSGTVIQNLHVTNPNGDCVTLSNSSNITIRASEIGPCKGNGVVITGGTSISVLDNYIHPEGQLAGCCDITDGILTNGTSNLTVQGNVIAYGEANIEAAGQTNFKIIGNFFLNPRGGANHRGQNIQVWNNNSGVTVQNNYTLASTDTTKYKFAEVQEDSINFGPNTSGIVVQGNYVTGGHSPSGCGVIADTGVVSGQFFSNTLLNTGQCGIGITSGVNIMVDSNKVLNTTPVSGGGNTAIYVWKVVSSDSCGPVQVSNNIASAITSSGAPSSYFDGGGCAPVTLTGNTFDLAAATLLSPPSSKLSPPPIPPGPASCVAPSPFSNNTAFAPCAPGTTAIAFGHVVIVLGEDTNASDAESGMPWLDALGAQYSTATQFYATTHPSVGNYMNMVTGQDITNDNTVVPLTFPVSVDNVVRELIASGKSWKQYAESIPSVGYLGTDSTCCGGQYYAHNVPLAYMADAQFAAQVTNIVPFTQFATDLANNALPNYSFITPNGCDDAHDCSIQTFDDWLKTNITPLLSNSQFLQNGVLIVAWDESASDITNGGGRVQFVLAGPTVKTAYSSSNLYQWPSLCRLSLEGLDVATIPAACSSAPSMLEFFVTSAPPPPTTESLSATSLTFPSQVINSTSAAQTVTLTNTGTASLNITSIVPSGDYAQTTTCGTSVAAAGTCTISVTFTPTATGTRTGAITITDNATGSPHIISLTGTGSAALTSSIRLAGKFTEAMSGSTSVSSQTVTNTGFAISSGDLIVVIVRFASSGASATTCSDNVNPGNYTQAHYQEDTSNGRAMIQYYKANSASAPSGSLTITCRYPAANHAYLGALDYSGAATTNPLDGHIGTNFTTATTSPTSGSITPTQSGDLFVGSLYISEGSTVTVSTESTGFTTELRGNEGTANYQHSHTADEVLSSTTAQNYNPRFSSSLTTIDIMTAYKDGGSGGGSAGLSFSPTSLSFGNQNVNTTSAAQTVTLTNSGTRRSDHHQHRRQRAVRPDQHLRRFRCRRRQLLHQRHLHAHGHRQPARHDHRHRQRHRQPADRQPHRHGRGAPASSFLPTSLAFGNQNVNTTSAAQTVTLTNSGTAALNITSIAASAPYAQTNTCGASVAAGANCSISVTFTPTATGSQPGTITVTDNATGSPQTVGPHRHGRGAQRQLRANQPEPSAIRM